MFGLFKKEDINDGVKRLREDKGAVLVDVRTRQEFAGGHIPGAVNVPLTELGDFMDSVPDTDTPVYVHCLSGGRSRQAVSKLKKMGYTNVCNIGGIENFQGQQQRGKH